MIQGDLSTHPKAGVKQERILCKADNYELLDTIRGMVDAGNISQVRIQKAFPLVCTRMPTDAAGCFVRHKSLMVGGTGWFYCCGAHVITYRLRLVKLSTSWQQVRPMLNII